MGSRRDIGGLLSPAAYQFPVASNPISRAEQAARRISAPDNRRRSSSPAPRPIALGRPLPSPPSALPSFDKAYRRLSNAAMAQSGGSLSRLGTRTSPTSTLSRGSVDMGRLEKDKDPDAVIESSSSSDTESDSERLTSRNQSPTTKSPPPLRNNQEKILQHETKYHHTPLSLSAAADQERSLRDGWH